MAVSSPIGSEQLMPRKTVQKTVFGDRNLNSQDPTFPFRQYGYRPDGKALSEAYLAKISSLRNAATVTAPLQENIMMRVESKWSPFVPTSILANANKLSQLFTGGEVSIITKATTRRIWSGSTPMILSLKLSFNAIYDPISEVVEPLRILGTIALPSENNVVSNDSAFAGIVNKLPFLGPPGPSPFKLEGVVKKQAVSKTSNDLVSRIDALQGGDKIQIRYGKFLIFSSVIVKEVSLTVPIKFDKIGNPVSANVDIIFETYEMMTAESFQDAFKNRTLSVESPV